MPPAPRCGTCAKRFACQSDLKKHRRDFHRDQNTTPPHETRSSFKCLEGCELSYTKCAELRLHLKDVHNQSHEVEYLKFATKEEYTSWLRTIEDNIPGKYVMSRGTTRTKTAENITLNCRHSGKSKCTQNIENTEASIDHGQIKIEGSSLRDSACTSQIKVTKHMTDGTYSVTHHKNHYGHRTNIDILVSKLKESIDPYSQTTSELLSTKTASTQHKEKSKSNGNIVKCNLCKKEFFYKRNAYAHMRRIHKIEMVIKKEKKIKREKEKEKREKTIKREKEKEKKEKTIKREKEKEKKEIKERSKSYGNIVQCNICKKEYSSKKALYVHTRRIHKMEMLVKKEKKFKCDNCERKFVHKSDLHRHSIRFHKTDNRTSTKKCRLVCPYKNCQEQFLTYAQMRTHLCNIHDIDIEFEVMTFYSKDEFEKWIAKMEQKTMSLYSKHSGIMTKVDGSQKQYYDCHRSYMYVNQGKNQRRSVVSKKINKACPSRVEVTFSNSQVSVIFWKTHCGHTTQNEQICLDEDTKAEFAGELSQGVPFQGIIDNIQKCLTKEDFQSERLTERQKLYKMLRDLSITYGTERHHDDAVSIKLWVDEMKTMDECPVIFYKGRNYDDETDILKDEDFIIIIMTQFQANQLKRIGQDIICIDSIHGTNTYRYNLYSLITVDEYGSGCPVAFCFSNRGDESLFKLFFTCVKDCVGVIKPNVFMSNDAPELYDTWASIMGEVPHHLLCIWHVYQNWRKNLCKISSGKEKRALVYKTLRAVLRLTCTDLFNTCLRQLWVDLLSDPDTVAFGQFFEQHYVQKSHLWAQCYRMELGINTNMYLESLHKVLKHIYIEGKKNQRLDKTVDALMNISRYKMTFERVIETANLQRILKIKKSHLQSGSINLNSIEELSDSKWMVPSKTTIDRYVVQRDDEQVSCTYCALTCTDCNICIHTFSCSCLDNMIFFNICKHIHACARLCNNNLDDEKVENTSTDNAENELNELKADVSYNGNNEAADNIILLKNKLVLAARLCDKGTLDSDILKTLNEQADELIETLNSC